MNYASMTKNELLSTAKDLQITGRHDMSKADLVDALGRYHLNHPAPVAAADEDGDESDNDGDVAQDEGELLVIDMERAAEAAPIDPAIIRDTKRRYPSEAKRDSLGKVIRRGVRFNLNVPFAHKYYFLATHLADQSKWTDAYKTAVAAAPPQAQLIVKAMAKHGVTTVENAMLGAQVVDLAKSRGDLRTRTGSRELFAYYRKLLERLGVTHAADYGQEPDEA